MYENLSTLIQRGFGTWRNNLSLAVPFILQTGVIGILAMALVALLFASQPIEEADISDIAEILTSTPSILAIIGTLLVILAATAFFTAGAIEMAHQGTLEGKSSLSIMWAGGKRHFASMYLANLVIMAIMIAGALAIGLLTAGLLMQFSGLEALQMVAEGKAAMMDTSTTLTLMVGSMLMIAFALAASLALALAPYALVVEGMGPIEAIRRGMGFFRENPFDVFMIWIITLAISLAISLPGQVHPEGGVAILWPLINMALSLAVIAPLTTVWWTRLYLSRTGRLDRDGIDRLQETVYL